MGFVVGRALPLPTKLSFAGASGLECASTTTVNRSCHVIGMNAVFHCSLPFLLPRFVNRTRANQCLPEMFEFKIREPVNIPSDESFNKHDLMR